MKQPPPDAPYVTARIAEAGDVLMRMRDFSAFEEGVGKFWQELAEAAIESHGLWHARSKWPRPTETEIARMIEAFGWIRFLQGPPAMLVALRSLKVPGARFPLATWDALSQRFGLDAPHVRLMHITAITMIAEGLEREAKASRKKVAVQ